MEQHYSSVSGTRPQEKRTKCPFRQKKEKSSSLLCTLFQWEEFGRITVPSSQPKIRLKFFTQQDAHEETATKELDVQKCTRKYKVIKYSLSHSFLLNNTNENDRVIFYMCMYANVSGRKTENFLGPLLLMDKEIRSHAM